MKRNGNKGIACVAALAAAMLAAATLAAPFAGSSMPAQAEDGTEEESTEDEYAYLQELIDAGELTAADLIDMDALEGWATVEGEGLETTTGGGDATPVIATEFFQFWSLVEDDEPRVIIVAGLIEAPRDELTIEIGSNKTIVGIDEDATLSCGIEIKDGENVIVSNLNIHGGWNNVGSDDAVSVRNSHHVWLDHLNIWDGRDGNIDLVLGVDYITVSWCKLWYTSSSHTHRLASLISSGTDHDDTDMGKLNVTYHHCWFAENCDQRMPRVLYGQTHIYNNYYNCEDNTYCIGVGCYAEVLIENNYFENVNNPHQFMYLYARPASICAQGNIYDNTSGSTDEGVDGLNSELVELFTDPPYTYTLDAAEDVPTIVTAGAGPHTIVENPNKTEEPSEEPSEEPTEAASETPVTAYALGDVNRDGSVTSSDALLVLQYVVDLTTLDEEQCTLADVDADGSVTSADSLYILQYVVGLVDTF